MSRLRKHVLVIIKTNGENASFSKLFLNTHHDMDIKGFRTFLNNMENDGIILKHHDFLPCGEKLKEPHYYIN